MKKQMILCCLLLLGSCVAGIASTDSERWSAVMRNEGLNEPPKDALFRLIIDGVEPDKSSLTWAQTFLGLDIDSSFQDLEELDEVGWFSAWELLLSRDALIGKGGCGLCDEDRRELMQKAINNRILPTDNQLVFAQNEYKFVADCSVTDF